MAATQPPAAPARGRHGLAKASERQRKRIRERGLGDDRELDARWTMVCAICGRMPLMMQSAPIRRAAATVFSRCWATSVSTVGTPVMSMMAISRAGRDDLLQQVLHHDLGAALSSVPISGRARMPSHRCTTGVESSSSSCCWRLITSSRIFWKTSVM